jgi:hypothetical protein
MIALAGYDTRVALQVQFSWWHVPRRSSNVEAAGFPNCIG